MVQSDPQFKLRLPANLLNSIKDSAHASRRTMNADIVHRLEFIFAMEKPSAVYVAPEPDMLSLRDQVAMAALTGICSNDYSLNSIVPEQVAQWAYQFADAMLTERLKYAGQDRIDAEGDHG